MPHIIDDMSRCLTQKVTVEREIAHIFRPTGQKKYLAVKYVFIPPDNVLVHVGILLCTAFGSRGDNSKKSFIKLLYFMISLLS